MPIPAGLTSVPVRRTYLRVDGAPATGRVILVPISVSASSGLNVTLTAAAVEAKLDADGFFEVTLAASNDPDLPSINYIEVYEQVVGARGHYTVLVSEAHAIVGLDLSDAVPVEPVGQMGAYIPATAKGQPGGVAPLDGTGKVPTAHLPAGQGGDTGPLSWLHTQDSPSTVWLIAHELAFRPAAFVVLDHLGQRHRPGVSWPSATTVQLSFETPVRGTVRMS